MGRVNQANSFQLLENLIFCAPNSQLVLKRTGHAIKSIRRSGNDTFRGPVRFTLIAAVFAVFSILDSSKVLGRSQLAAIDSQSKNQSDEIDNPSIDGWDSEAFHLRVKKRLESLGNLLK